VDNQPYVLAYATVAFTHKSFMLHDGVCAPFRHKLNGTLHVLQSVDGTHRNPVIHWNDHGPARIAVFDALHSDPFAYDRHDLLLLFNEKRL
jgi:hypothetical protein